MEWIAQRHYATYQGMIEQTKVFNEILISECRREHTSTQFFEKLVLLLFVLHVSSLYCRFNVIKRRRFILSIHVMFVKFRNFEIA